MTDRANDLARYLVVESALRSTALHSAPSVLRRHGLQSWFQCRTGRAAGAWLLAGPHGRRDQPRLCHGDQRDPQRRLPRRGRPTLRPQ